MTGEVRSVFSDRRHGDLAIAGEPTALAARRHALAPHPWTWLRLVHGNDVVTVTEPGQHAGASADAAVTTRTGAALAVTTADCGPLLLVAPGAIGVAHVGWRGLAAGVVEATVAAMAALGEPPRTAVLGPSIRPRCYEFGGDDLDRVAARYGDAVRATTAAGAPALDVGAGIAVACDALGVILDDAGTCTACSPVHWSYRARQEAGRQALVAWREP